MGTTRKRIGGQQGSEKRTREIYTDDSKEIRARKEIFGIRTRTWEAESS
jgi:hypothetical protein